ncbi:hypothetical protein LOTGIDRAFT_122035 [Lottia gigantea]|uniref:Selenoprotein O n=1 Tax=Lottia gigantea TaxID=225164 RepID=V3ZJZ7_LOTGI|nr:hypothetical protein LOTGIDRAFT_122035 [Lottia gigantea]ESO91618.1 hypothetical protein LOTGIDRAFT_122035 [Lottia gigantea]
MKSINFCKAPKYEDLTKWPFPNSKLLYNTFPIDPEERNFVRRVSGAIFSKVNPEPLKTPVKLVAFSADVLNSILDLNSNVTTEKSFTDLVAGSLIVKGSVPLSHRYGGHQFGYWAEQLGDGRAVMLGEYVNTKGQRWELQLKGSGKTPYSRRGDGRAVLRSSIREFLCSEAMYYLGIPTSRAAGIVVSQDEVVRDQFYDGHPQIEQAAVVLRLAPSWFRFGSLEILEKSGEMDLLKKLVDFIIQEHFHSIVSQSDEKYTEFFWNVVTETASLVAQWQSVGFAHGVCNTDNFSLLSITIDYGPFGFLEEYKPSFVPNTSDDEGRYCYEKQPDVAIFNLEKLQTALRPLLKEEKQNSLSEIMKQFSVIYKIKFMEIFRRKLGLQKNLGEEDEQLVAMFLKMMEDKKSDFTITFRNLGEITLAALTRNKIPKKFWSLKKLQKHKWFENWIKTYVERFAFEEISDFQRRKIMSETNPKYILRNWMAQQAIEGAENGDFSEVKKLLRVLSRPFVTQLEAELSHYSSKPPSWSKTLQVSCSS